MEYDSKLFLLSPNFAQDYPPTAYPELMYKPGRPYNCLLIESHDYYICIPFRSYIGHKNAFLFTGSIRSKKARSGLDYSKIIIVKDTRYFDLTATATVDQDEYTEMMKNLSTIAQEANKYVATYINHINGTSFLHPKVYSRKYQYSTLPYFHNIILK